METQRRALELAQHPTYWQRVLHGDGVEMRREIVAVLQEEKSHKSMFRYACCGLSDQLAKRGDEVFVSPKGCGHKLCPRCGRRRGGKYAKRIIGWLANRPHGELWSMVLTQPVKPGERLKDARARMAPKQRAYMRWLTARGLVGAMTTVHIVWSIRSSGWHYHVHILVEMPEGQMSHAELLRRWEEEGRGEVHRTSDSQARRVCVAGPMIAELKDDAGDADFWHESTSGIAKQVQYPLRDLVQGVSAWRLGGDPERMRECARELVRDAGGWKCFRAWGAWRKPVVVEEAPPTAEGEKEKAAAPAPGESKPLGFVGRIWRAARGGNEPAREVLRRLEATCRNESEFAKRLVKFCRSAMGDGTVTHNGGT